MKNWPTDGKPHPERSIRNGVLGRNAAEAYQIDPDAKINEIRCDDVQEMRDKGYLEGERSAAPFAARIELRLRRAHAEGRSPRSLVEAVGTMRRRR